MDPIVVVNIIIVMYFCWIKGYFNNQDRDTVISLR